MMMFRMRHLLYFIITLLTVSCNFAGRENAEEALSVADTSAPSDTSVKHVAKEPALVFGIPSNSYRIVTGHIKPNRFLSEILLNHGVTMQEIDQVLKNSDTVLDVRKIRSGTNYSLFCDTDSVARVRYLLYEHDPVTNYVFSFNDSLNITRFSKEISKEIKYSAGVIETSLWEAMIRDGIHPMVASELSVIFAWTVDFFGVQKGDSFKVIYEEEFIDGKSIGIDRIFGAQFTWEGRTITAIPFIQGGKESFFDADGNSLRKAFLKAPLQFTRISSRYSANRLHPILRIRRPHLGVDYAAPVGTPVVSIGDGKVIFAGTENGSGRMVRIVHNSVYSTAYLHLSGFGKGIYPGAMVKQGDIVGYVGSSGLSTGPHLDFRFYMNGSPVDPLKVEAPSVEPVADTNRIKFEINRSVVGTLLETF